jgi:hypothetical protein
MTSSGFRSLFGNGGRNVKRFMEGRYGGGPPLQDKTIIAVISEKAMSAPAVPRSAEIRARKEEFAPLKPYRRKSIVRTGGIK